MLFRSLYNEITGSNKECFVMGGGTYARKLPHAFAYGLGGMEETQEDKRIRSELFLPGHGSSLKRCAGLDPAVACWDGTAGIPITLL